MKKTLTIGIAVYNRKSLLEAMAKSLKMSDLSAFETHIRLYDDCSTEFDEKYLKKLFPFAATIRRNETNLKADLNTYNMYLDFFNSGDDYFFNADSDLIFNKNWLSFIQENFSKTDGVLSVFNAKENHPVIAEEGNLVQKEHIGAAGTFFSRERVGEIIEFLDEENRKEIDWGFSKLFKSRNVRIFCSKESYVQHIGLIGGQNHNLYCLDYGTNFTVDSPENGQIINDLLLNIVKILPSDIDNIRAEITAHVENNYRNTIDFKLGSLLLKPGRIIKHLLKR